MLISQALQQFFKRTANTCMLLVIDFCIDYGTYLCWQVSSILFSIIISSFDFNLLKYLWSEICFCFKIYLVEYAIPKLETSGVKSNDFTSLQSWAFCLPKMVRGMGWVNPKIPRKICFKLLISSVKKMLECRISFLSSENCFEILKFWKFNITG